jgi:hypothetical protein
MQAIPRRRGPAAAPGYRLPRADDQPKKFRTLLTDEQVLECRVAFEFNGAASLELAKIYGTSPAYMRDLLSYKVRSKLIPSLHTV